MKLLQDIYWFLYEALVMFLWWLLIGNDQNYYDEKVDD